MIQSMTGYGKAQLNLKTGSFIIELRSLNSKQTDINLRLSAIYRSKEISLRNLLSKKLKRGKIELFISNESSAANTNYNLNSERLKEYFSQIELLTNELNLNIKDIMPTLLKLPDVLVKPAETVDKADWNEIEKGVSDAVEEVLKFRLDEGKKLEKDIDFRINKLASLLLDLAPLSVSRIEKVKKNILEKLAEINTNEIDENRLEKELVYYLEKQDITEEQVRLDAHLDYFKETMKTPSPNGKKLGFIGQEIGREINTIGSKASDADMQKIVVQMKDELEKVKEQLLNIL